MKKFFMFLAVLGLMTVSAQFQVAYAQEEETPEVTTEDVQTAPAVEEEEIDDPFAAASTDQPMHQALKQKFIEGGPGFMATILLCLIFGLAIAIERIITLSLAQTDTKKLIANVDKALKEGGIEKAKDVCRDTRGPVASIFYQGLLRADQGLETVEKTVASYGSVQMGQLESGLSWITLFIAIAPMLGFLGTVVGLVLAFDAIEIAGDISPALVAHGMKVALITTIGGLIVAIILQLFYNYLIAKVESIVVQMEDASISLIDLLVKYEK
ncbi:MAG: MotA/TolQ/ExbB proton channel family protein [Bacteroidales bacterium]|jgi:biopolymer transport protein ExbB|nr:MotA/TolQ/ExbB proton channel family protein [Bacteroidales bacterium]